MVGLFERTEFLLECNILFNWFQVFEGFHIIIWSYEIDCFCPFSAAKLFTKLYRFKFLCLSSSERTRAVNFWIDVILPLIRTANRCKYSIGWCFFIHFCYVVWQLLMLIFLIFSWDSNHFFGFKVYADWSLHNLNHSSSFICIHFVDLDITALFWKAI